ncbi:hypothetical protein EON66_06855 [archaeon]|nr:MAG: hypothetical protein EON66_06855 [archaeon]
MRVRVLCFASVRAAVGGASVLEVDVGLVEDSGTSSPPTCTLPQVLSAVKQVILAAGGNASIVDACAVAKGDAYVTDPHHLLLVEGDEIALLPPVSGG